MWKAEEGREEYIIYCEKALRNNWDREDYKNSCY